MSFLDSFFKKKKKVTRRKKTKRKVTKRKTAKKKTRVSKRISPKGAKKKTVKKKVVKKKVVKKSKKTTKKPKSNVLKKTITLKLKNIRMDKKPLYATDTLPYAIEFFSKNKLIVAPVLNEKKIIGLVTIDDLTNAVNKKGMDILTKGDNSKVSKIMRKVLVNIQSSKSFSEAIEMMNKKKVENLLVYEKGKFVGVINKDEIFETIARILRKPKLTPSAEIETDIDDFYFKIMKKQQASANYLSRVLDVELETIEEWGNSLAEHNMIEIIYTPFGNMMYKINKRFKK